LKILCLIKIVIFVHDNFIESEIIKRNRNNVMDATEDPPIKIFIFEKVVTFEFLFNTLQSQREQKDFNQKALEFNYLELIFMVR